MMINKRLINSVSESKKFIAGNVISQWTSLVGNITMMTGISSLMGKLYEGTAETKDFAVTAVIAVFVLIVRFICTYLNSRFSYLSSKAVKRILRESIYKKLLRLGASYREQVNTSEVVQVAVEGVDQLQTYFGAYLPQFFYAMLAPVTLFVYMSFIDITSAVVLLICVPMIPVAIAAVQTWAKKLLSKYWGQYTALGDTFLENLQGLTTLKIYKSDDFKNDEMNEQSERFRVITMKVLTMQLNSITIMDIIAYGGAALGMIFAVTAFRKGNIDLAEAVLIVFLSADFFIPMRQLGSFFHIAMNGMAASDKIFRLLDLPESEEKALMVPENTEVVCKGLRFSYDEEREILHGIDMVFEKGKFTALVGESGCGKSTVAGILMGRNKGYKGDVLVGGVPLNEISEESLMTSFTYIGHMSYLFKGTVRDNLLMGNPDANDEELIKVLKRVNLWDFLNAENGLDTQISEKGSNFSGGQCQRLALARALLHDSEVYIFDEATSNIDVESENDIMREIYALAKEKTVILISHRLVNVKDADMIYVLAKGDVKEKGSHSELLALSGEYQRLWTSQQQLEKYAGGEGI